MTSGKLVLVIIVLLMLGGAGTWGAMADDTGAVKSGRAGSGDRETVRRRIAARMADAGTDGRAVPEATFGGETADGVKPEDSGTRPDAKPDQIVDGDSEGEDKGIRSKIRKEIGDAIDAVKEPDGEAKPVTSVASATVESVTKDEAPAAAQGSMVTSIGIMGGDRAGLDQTRQGHRPPGLRRLKKPAEGTVPPANAEPLKGLFGEYYTLSKDPRNEVRGGRDPLLGEVADYTRIDDSVYFPNRNSFGAVASADHVAVRWSGLLRVPAAGKYFLALGNDAGGALVIDGQAVIVNDVMVWYVETWAQVELSEGWHRIEIHHVEGPQGDDKSRNMACVFQWKPTWEEAARPVPGDWLGVPLELQAPELEAVEPVAGVEVCGTITLKGKRFKQAAKMSVSVGSDGKVGMFVEDQSLSVYVDGLPAGDVKLLGDDTVTCVVPPGAGSGKVELRRGRVPSNQKDVTVTTTFGLVLSVWDLTGYPQTLDVPEGRAPDYVVHDEQPFPLTRAKFPQFDGKTILVRAEGMITLYTNEDIYAFSGRQPMMWGHLWAAGTSRNWELTVLQKTVRPEHEELNKWGKQGIEPITLSDALSAHALLSYGNQDYNWAAISSRVLFVAGLSSPLEAIDEEFSVLSDIPLHARETRTSHFKPSVKLPPRPGISLDANLSAPGSQLPSGVPTVRTGAELLVLVDANALDNAESPLTFTVDDAPAAFRLHDDAALVTVRDPEGRLRTRRKVWVTIPEDASHGVLRARRGIVQSSPIQIDVANRGLVGMYYDFNEVLREIPNMSGMTPLVRRIDKHLEFQNGTDFKLPFPAERFSSEWFGSLRAPVAGEYTFVIQSDDGVRLKLAGQTVVEFPGLRPPGISTARVTLGAGWHDLHLEFFENDVLENMVVWWIPPGKTVKEFIPLKYLSTDSHTPVPNKWPVGQVPVGG